MSGPYNIRDVNGNVVFSVNTEGNAGTSLLTGGATTSGPCQLTLMCNPSGSGQTSISGGADTSGNPVNAVVIGGNLVNQSGITTIVGGYNTGESAANYVVINAGGNGASGEVTIAGSTSNGGEGSAVNIYGVGTGSGYGNITIGRSKDAISLNTGATVSVSSTLEADTGITLTSGATTTTTGIQLSVTEGTNSDEAAAITFVVAGGTAWVGGDASITCTTVHDFAFAEKEDILIAKDLAGIPAVCNMKVCQFVRKGDPQKKLVTGFMGEQLGTVCTAGSHNKERDIWTVSSSQVAAYCVKAIQELAAENKFLRSEISRLGKEILEARTQDLWEDVKKL